MFKWASQMTNIELYEYFTKAEPSEGHPVMSDHILAMAKALIAKYSDKFENLTGDRVVEICFTLRNEYRAIIQIGNNKPIFLAAAEFEPEDNGNVFGEFTDAHYMSRSATEHNYRCEKRHYTVQRTVTFTDTEIAAIGEEA